ncbi:MAG: hypothetical protein WCL14_02565, partial [Bacteroidota bacterium]
LSMACEYYSMAINVKNESRFDEQLDSFLYEVSEVIYSALKNQVNQENSRIHDTVELIMKLYLNYLKIGIERITPEWSLTIGHYALDDIKMPEINLSFLKSEVETKIETKVETKYTNKTRTVRRWYSLWLIPETENYKESYTEEYEISYKLLPNAEAIYQKAIARMRMKGYSAAIRDFKAYLKLKPENAMGYLQRGICYDKSGQPYLACKDWWRASQRGLKEADALMKMKCK